MNILIVESRAKCKTLLKHLGKNEWRVLSTGGHMQRLAEDRKIHPPKEVRKAYWSHQPGELPVPPWFWTERGEAAIGAIKDEAAKHDSVTLYLAADPDREGERIAWHLEKLLSGVGPRHRVTFQEITKSAVLSATTAPRKVNQALVDAALIRTFIDRVVGWRASRIARRYTTSSTNSMGRVQTPTRTGAAAFMRSPIRRPGWMRRAGSPPIAPPTRPWPSRPTPLWSWRETCKSAT